jgi:hypothetical protein
LFLFVHGYRQRFQESRQRLCRTQGRSGCIQSAACERVGAWHRGRASECESDAVVRDDRENVSLSQNGVHDHLDLDALERDRVQSLGSNWVPAGLSAVLATPVGAVASRSRRNTAWSRPTLRLETWSLPPRRNRTPGVSYSYIGLRGPLRPGFFPAEWVPIAAPV